MLQNNKNKEFRWGLKPSPTLKKFINIIPKGMALDIGAGEGRNSIFLAQNGFEVEALDKNKESLDKCKDIAQKENLSITTIVGDAKDFKFENNKYSLIIAKSSLDFLKKSEAKTIIYKIKDSLIKGGFAQLSFFSPRDPAYQQIKEMELKEVENNTFYLPKYQTYRCFFTKKELEKLFDDFKIIYSEEVEIQDPGHGEAEPHIHYTVEIVAQKIKATD